MAEKFLEHDGAGRVRENEGLVASAGAADAGKIPALDAAGRLDNTLMPVGIGADTAVIVASEALAAGDLVNVHSVAGAFRVRKADASVAGKEAHGFVLAVVANAGNATVFFEGPNTQVVGLTPGVQFLSDVTPGGTVAAAPAGAGKVVQRVGVAVAAAVLNFESGPVIVLA